MPSKARHSRKGPTGDRTRPRPKWLPWGGLGLAVLALVLLASIGPDRIRGFVAGLFAPRSQGPLSLTIVHSNDTWGYVLPCG